MVNIKTSSAIANHEPSWSIEHKHNAVEISVVFEGEGLFYAENRITEIKEGSVILVRNNVEHCFQAITPIRFGVLMIDFLPVATAQFFEQLLTTSQTKIISLSRH